MNACPYCNTEIVDGFYFCANCEQQVKCRQCHSLLLADKSRCLVCGSSTVAQNSQMVMSTLDIEENQTPDSYHRRVNVQATDYAVSQFAPFLGAQLTVSHVVPQPARPLQSPESLLQLQLDNIMTPAEEQSVGEPRKNIQTAEPAKDQALQVFTQDGEDQLIATVLDYKGKSKRDQQRRFVLLYVWAYPLVYERNATSRSQVVSSAKKTKIYDGNFTANFDQALKEYMIHIEVGYRLNQNGVKQIETILGEMASDGEGFTYWKSTTPTRRSQRGSKDKNGSRIEAWIEASKDVDSFDIRKLDQPTHYAMFATWLITKAIHQEEAVYPHEAYIFLKRKYTAISVDEKAFSTSFRRTYNAEKFRKTSDGRYYLTPEAESVVIGWTNGIAVHNTRESVNAAKENSLL